MKKVKTVLSIIVTTLLLSGCEIMAHRAVKAKVNIIVRVRVNI